MKGRIIAVDYPKGRASAAALIVDGRVEDLLLDPKTGDATPLVGEIRRGKVRRAPGGGGAFLDLGDGVEGWLREAKGVSQGDALTVQVAAVVEPGKAAPVTTRLLFKGRYAILTPGAEGVNVARALKGREERERLTAIAVSALGDAETGAIIRSAAEDADAADLADDIASLLETCEAVMRHEADAPERLVDGAGAEFAAWRDWAPPEPDEVIREEGIFDRLGVWDEIEALRRIRADLPGGGWMSIEPTRAFISIDVNTGSDLSNAAAARANLAACAELPRQLRLRGLGGAAIIDFAPMRKVDRKAVEGALRRAFGQDPIRTTLAGWTPMGAFELQRKRERRPLSELVDG